MTHVPQTIITIPTSETLNQPCPVRPVGRDVDKSQILGIQIRAPFDRAA